MRLITACWTGNDSLIAAHRELRWVMFVADCCNRCISLTVAAAIVSHAFSEDFPPSFEWFSIGVKMKHDSIGALLGAWNRPGAHRSARHWPKDGLHSMYAPILFLCPSAILLLCTLDIPPSPPSWRSSSQVSFNPCGLPLSLLYLSLPLSPPKAFCRSSVSLGNQRRLMKIAVVMPL